MFCDSENKLLLSFSTIISCLIDFHLCCIFPVIHLKTCMVAIIQISCFFIFPFNIPISCKVMMRWPCHNNVVKNSIITHLECSLVLFVVHYATVSGHASDGMSNFFAMENIKNQANWHVTYPSENILLKYLGLTYLHTLMWPCCQKDSSTHKITWCLLHETYQKF